MSALAGGCTPPPGDTRSIKEIRGTPTSIRGGVGGTLLYHMEKIRDSCYCTYDEGNDRAIPARAVSCKEILFGCPELTAS